MSSLSLPTARLRPGPVRPRAALVPGLLICAGYVDPGNWGTAASAGARFGDRLMWVVPAATAIAWGLQQLAAWVGYHSGQDLAGRLARTRLPARIGWGLLILVTLTVTESVELVGVVLGLQLTLHLGAVAAALAGLPVVLGLLWWGHRGGSGEALVRAVCLLVVLVAGLVVAQYLQTQFGQTAGLQAAGTGLRGGGLLDVGLPAGSAPMALGLLGATVMPHNLLLQSSLAARGRRPGLRATACGNALLLGAAAVVNLALIGLAAAGTGFGGLGGAATGGTSTLLGLGLLAAGAASISTGSMAGDALAPFGGLFIRPAVRRLLPVGAAGLLQVAGVPALTCLVGGQILLAALLPPFVLALAVAARRVPGRRSGAVAAGSWVVGVAITAASAAALALG